MGIVTKQQIHDTERMINENYNNEYSKHDCYWLLAAKVSKTFFVVHAYFWHEIESYTKLLLISDFC